MTETMMQTKIFFNGKRNRVKILISKKLVIRLPILLVQMKAGDNSYDLKKESDE